MYRENVLDLYIRGRMHGDTFEIPGDVSSQFLSGLLFALPFMDEDSRIIIPDVYKRQVLSCVFFTSMRLSVYVVELCNLLPLITELF